MSDPIELTYIPVKYLFLSNCTKIVHKRIKMLLNFNVSVVRLLLVTWQVYFQF